MFSHRYAIRQCNEYGKLGLLGTTVLYSSGDFGVAGYGGVCQNSSGERVRLATGPEHRTYIFRIG
jgi:tripeptidyl-peptidase-1